MWMKEKQAKAIKARAASLSSEAVPADLLTIRAPAPDWFRWAISHAGQSQFVMVAGCRIHYLHWARVGEAGRLRPAVSGPHLGEYRLECRRHLFPRQKITCKGRLGTE